MLIQVLLTIALLVVMGLVGLVATGGLPGANAEQNKMAGDAAAKIAPFAGIIGIVGLVLGLWGLISFLTAIGFWFSYPVNGILFIAGVAVLVGLGLIMAYPLISQALSGSAEGQKAAAQALETVKPFQRPLAMGAIGLGVLMLVRYILSLAGIYL
jgi:hypothetical protein